MRFWNKQGIIGITFTPFAEVFMFFYEGYICPVCKEPLRDGEDIVSCPQCGAPHHRACWQQTGHCFFDADHGTEHQWSREAAERVQESAPVPPENRCAQCGADNAPDQQIKK